MKFAFVLPARLVAAIAPHWKAEPNRSNKQHL